MVTWGGYAAVLTGTMTHDYKRHGTTTLFAALNVLEGKVIGRCMQRQRHQEFIRFLNAIEKTVPTKKTVHVTLRANDLETSESEEFSLLGVGPRSHGYANQRREVGWSRWG